MKRKLVRTGLLVAVLALIAGLFAACGSDDAAGDGKLEVDAGGLTGEPIRIGTLCSCTGPLAASLGQSLDVLKAWGNWTNANGGINGHPVEVIAYDDGQNPATGLAKAKQLVEEDKVVAIVGTMSLVSDQWASYVSGKGIPVVGGQPVDTSFFTDPNFFASGSTLPLLLLGEVTQAAKSGAKELGLFYCSETPVCAQLPAIVKPLAAQAGMKVVEAKVSQSAPKYLAECQSMKDKGVDAVFAAVNSDVVPRIAESCAQQGFNPTQIASSATTQKSWTTDENLDGSIVVATNAVYTDASVPGVKNFLDGLKEYAPEVLESPQFSFPLIYPWAGGELFKAAAEAGDISPTSTGTDVVAGLRKLEGETLDGLAPPLTFPEGQPGFPLCYFTAKLTGGEFKSDPEQTCIEQDVANAMLVELAKAG